jgi:hypothetical protein
VEVAMSCERIGYFDLTIGGRKEKRGSVSHVAEMKEQNVSRLLWSVLVHGGWHWNVDEESC